MQQQVGSAYYVAPEVLRGHYSESCDMWSMGIILYMLVSGVPPFWGSSDSEIKQRILRGKYSFPARQFQHVSSEAIDLIRKLLEVDPTRRFTAADALQHSWIQKAQERHARAADASRVSGMLATTGKDGMVAVEASESSLDGMAVDKIHSQSNGSSVTHADASENGAITNAMDIPPHAEIAQCLREFTNFTAMRKLMLEVVAFNLSAREITGLREEFEALDVDKSGTLSVEELHQVFQSQMVTGASSSVSGSGGTGMVLATTNTLERDIGRIFDAVSVHHGHSINYTEFIAATMWRRLHLDEDRIHQAFDLLDKEHKGYLTATAIQNAVGQDFSPEAVSSMVAECDFNGDGRVDYLEFERLWKTYSVDQHQEHLLGLHDNFKQHHDGSSSSESISTDDMCS